MIRGSASSDPYLTQQWWVPGTPGGSVNDATECLSRFRDMWVILMAKVASTFTWEPDPVCLIVDHSTGELQGAFAGTPGLNITGSGGSSPLPLQTQGLLRWSTDGVVRGRRVLGRTYVPAPDEADNTTSGQASSSYTAQLNSGATALLTNGSPTEVPVTWSRPTTPGGSNGQISNITSGAGISNWSVQRSRR